MKCTATTKTGERCPVTATRNSRPPRCPMHGKQASSYQRKGVIGQMVKSRLRHYLAETTPKPDFASTAAIEAWASTTAHQVLTGVLDPRAASEARQLAALTISARSADEQSKLVDALLALEHGGAAVALLAQFTSDPTRRKPLPGRVLAMPAATGDSA